MSTASDQFIYDIPIISTGLRPEETIHQICDALQFLKTLSTDVFDRLNNRILENRSKLADINSRISTARTKIDALKGVNKATRVFSSAKYPSSGDEAPYSTIYAPGPRITLERAPVKIQTKHVPVTEEILREKLKSFDTPMHLDVTMKKDLDRGEGLGSLPQNISSVSSLLLFNTSENPYKKYVILDPLGVVTKTRKEEVDESLPDAPQTILQHEEMHHQTAENYLYMPGMGDVPEIAVPDSLPNLVGVADDLSYSADLGPSIAPSVPIGKMAELPEFTQDDALPVGPMSVKTDSIQSPAEHPVAPPAVASPVDVPPPPPPPPPPPLSEAPPPPPPPPALPSLDERKQAIDIPPSDASRASLLESIRQAGGIGKAKLKSAKERKIAVKKQKQEEKDHGKLPNAGTSGGGDLMSDLTAKLLLRRKGISGSVKPGEKDNNSGSPASNLSSRDSALDRISAMIPPPASNKVSQDDEDWN